MLMCKVESGGQKAGLIDDKHSFLTSDLTENDVLKALNIKSIPRYVVFDKTGALVNPRCPAPQRWHP